MSDRALAVPPAFTDRRRHDIREVRDGDRLLGTVLRLLSDEGYCVTWYAEFGMAFWAATNVDGARLLRMLDIVARHAGDLDATIAALTALRDQEKA